MKIPVVFGAVFFFMLFYTRVMAMVNGSTPVSALNMLVTAQAGMVFLLLFFRRKSKMESDWRLRILAWGSAILPLTMSLGSSSPVLGLMPIPGLLLNLWALAVLGQSFSISPADRRLVVTGPYQLVRHPMYAGELLSLLGAVLVSFSWVNAVLYVVFVGALVVRIQHEERVVSGYCAYAELVRWRILPGVW